MKTQINQALIFSSSFFEIVIGFVNPSQLIRVSHV